MGGKIPHHPAIYSLDQSGAASLLATLALASVLLGAALVFVNVMLSSTENAKRFSNSLVLFKAYDYR